MKNLVLLPAMIITLAFNSCISKSNKLNHFSGYIPIGAKPTLVWVPSKEVAGDYDLDVSVLVVTSTDSIIAHLYSYGNINGRYYVLYRDSYPMAKDNKVYVKGFFDKKRTPIIVGASTREEFLESE